MGEDRSSRRPAGCRAKHGADDGHLAEQLHGTLEAVHAREDGVAAPVERRDTAAGAVDQVYQGNAIIGGQVLDEAALTSLLAVAGPADAAAHGEILAAHRDRTTVDAGKPHDVGRRGNAAELAVGIAALAGEDADLLKAALVDQPVDALADGEAALLVVLGDRFRTAELQRLASPQAQLGGLGVPGARWYRFGLVAHRRFTGSPPFKFRAGRRPGLRTQCLPPSPAPA